MKQTIVLTGMLLAFVAGDAIAQDEKELATGMAAQGSGQGQADVKADGNGAAATGKAAGAAGAQAGESSAALAQGTEINATLTRPVDAGKAKPGDEVTAKAAKDIKSGGEVVVPRGSMLIGRVTRAEPRKTDSASGKSASELGIVFDRAVLKDGSAVPLNGSVAALATARSTGSARSSPLGAGANRAGGTAGSAGASGGLAGTVGGVAGATTGAAGGISSTIGGTGGTAGRSAGAVGGFDAAGGLRSGSRGVFGVRDLDIATSTTGDAEGSVITSAQRNVRLESGTQMLVLAGGSAGQKPAATSNEPAREPVDKR
ncbi:MAG: hypothetical protein ACREVI_08130 [Steroidobacteraceae bacterium]